MKCLTSSACSVEAANLTAPSTPLSLNSESAPAPSPTSNKRRPRKPSSAPASATDCLTTPPSGPMSSLSPEQGLEAMLTELSQASPASPSRSLAKSLASRMSATCSAMSCESLMNLTPDFSFWKTRQGCLFQTASDPTSQPQYQTYLGSWPKAVLIVRGCLYPQPTWERRMVGSAGGASLGENWKSPNTRDDHPQGPRAHRGDRQETLVDQVQKKWFTPHGQANVDHTGKIGGGGELDMQIRDWATPQAHDVHPGDAARVGRFGTAAGGRNLTDEVQQWPSPRTTDANGSGSHGTGGADLRTSVERWTKLADAEH
jgi:hypothetical protein